MVQNEHAKSSCSNPSTSSRFSYSFMKFMNQYDNYGRSIPGFNLNGDSKISSSLGSAVTLISGIVVLIYAASKMSHL